MIGAGRASSLGMKAEFEKLFALYSDVIFRFCLYKTSDRQVAHDLTQDTFLRLWKAMNSADQKIEKPKQYLYQIARNLVIDHYKKAKAVSLDMLQEDGFDPKETKMQSADTMSEIGILRKAIEDLEADYREVVYMRFVEGLGIEEIAETLNISTNLVSVRINRGRKKLQTLFI
jgi:RNA polymerase sigma-70 factor (ECF subfamily)